MKESEIIREVSRRTAVPEPSTEKVLHALRELVRDGAVDERGLLHDAGLPFANPRDPRLVDDLIARAQTDPHGLELLRCGHLGTVAITFGTHAFTVEAARARLRTEPGQA